MKKLLVLGIILIFVFTAAVSVYADGMALKSVDTILTEIQKEQGVQSVGKINPDKVSQAKLEELGDSVMEAMIGNTALHDQMDIRLGGDGSASLTAFHIRLGYNYLVGYPNGMMNLMSGGMMGYNNNRALEETGYGMMGPFRYAGIAMGLFLLLLIVAIILIVRSILKPGNTRTYEPALETLSRRLAKGEITNDEFAKMKNNIKALK